MMTFALQDEEERTDSNGWSLLNYIHVPTCQFMPHRLLSQHGVHLFTTTITSSDQGFLERFISAYFLLKEWHDLSNLNIRRCRFI